MSLASADEVPRTRPRAGEVVLSYLTEQVEAIGSREPSVRALDQGAIHKTRVATRRLRSVLSSYRSLVRRDQTDPLRAELQWLASVLGAVRDVHVVRERLREVGDAGGSAAVPAPVERELAEREEAASGQLLVALDSPRYALLRQRLEHLMADPPLRGAADRAARRVMPRLVGDAARAVDGAAELADAEGLSPVEREERLHDVRKAAKRARYAAELALPVGGKGAERLVQRMTELQELLGQHQDQVMLERTLEEMSGDKGSGGAPRSPAPQPVEETAYRVALRSIADEKVRGWTNPPNRSRAGT